jgi:hypothetical protein
MSNAAENGSAPFTRKPRRFNKSTVGHTEICPIASVYIGEDTNGKRKYHSKIVNGKKKDADDELIELSRQNSLGLLSDDRNQTLSEYLDTWLKSIAKPEIELSNL